MSPEGTLKLYSFTLLAFSFFAACGSYLLWILLFCFTKSWHIFFFDRLLYFYYFLLKFWRHPVKIWEILLCQIPFFLFLNRNRSSGIFLLTSKYGVTPAFLRSLVDIFTSFFVLRSSKSHQVRKLFLRVYIYITFIFLFVNTKFKLDAANQAIIFFLDNYVLR